MTNHASSQSRWAFQPANAIGPQEKPSADDVSVAVGVPTTTLVVLATAGAASDPW